MPDLHAFLHKSAAQDSGHTPDSLNDPKRLDSSKSMSLSKPKRFYRRFREILPILQAIAIAVNFLF